MTFAEQIISAIKNFCEASGSREKAADRLGVSVNTLNSWYYGQKVPNIDTLSKYADKLGITLEPIKSATAQTQNNDLQECPVYAAAGAGTPFIKDDSDILTTIYVPKSYIRKSDFAVLVNGESMMPHIPNGAFVGIKENVPFNSNNVYLASIPYHGLVIKRIIVDLATNEFVFKSDNPNKEAYPDFRMAINEAEKVIIGIPVWVLCNYG